MYGLTMRWSLDGAPEAAYDALRDYVRDESYARFAGRAGLHQKVWSMAGAGPEGAFFAGTYLWISAEARVIFLESFRATPSRVSEIVGHGPDVIEEFEVVAVAEGEAGLGDLPRWGTAFR